MSKLDSWRLECFAFSHFTLFVREVQGVPKKMPVSVLQAIEGTRSAL